MVQQYLNGSITAIAAIFGLVGTGSKILENPPQK
ncbi:putative membrane protein [Prescottella equi 103S]|uniref:Membrane protein n=1 Tax=Rhodococcus hoagii (strain 103S) TaxID=685727 RepID=A0A3S5YD74_RHOH1|nr:putative membrane protein [Prescottella equi 103S]